MRTRRAGFVWLRGLRTYWGVGVAWVLSNGFGIWVRASMITTLAANLHQRLVGGRKENFKRFEVLRRRVTDFSRTFKKHLKNH